MKKLLFLRQQKWKGCTFNYKIINRYYTCDPTLIYASCYFVVYSSLTLWTSCCSYGMNVPEKYHLLCNKFIPQACVTRLHCYHGNKNLYNRGFNTRLLQIPHPTNTSSIIHFQCFILLRKMLFKYKQSVH